MATIDFDSDLLVQPLHEKTLSGVSQFRAIFDNASNPVIFAALNDGSLLLLTENAERKVIKTDLSKLLGLSSDEKITALAVSQSSTDDVYLAFASGLEGQASNLRIFPSVRPDSATQWWNLFTKEAVCKGPTNAPDLLVTQLLLAPKVTDAPGVNYPFLAAVTSKTGAAATKDIARIEVDISTKNWTWATDLTYPYNLANLKDCCVGVLPTGSSGIFGLDTTQGKTSVTFAGISHDQNGARSPLNFQLPVVANARAIATTLDKHGYTNLLIGGDGILHVASLDITDSKDVVQPATITDKYFSGIRKLSVAQQGRKCALWLINGDDNLIGCTATLKQHRSVDHISANGPATPLLSMNDKLQTFDAVHLNNPTSHQVFALARDGTVTHLQQLGESASWTEQRFQIPEVEDVQDVNTYSCHVRVSNANRVPAGDTVVHLKSSTISSCIVNGGRICLSPEVTRIKTDAQGVVVLTLPAPGLKVPNITVTLPADVEKNRKGAVSAVFNPADKAIQKLAASAKANTLKDATKSDGSKLFSNLDDDKKDMIVQLVDHYTEQMPRGNGTSTAAPVVTAMSIAAADEGPLDIRAAAIWDDVEEFGWEVWHGVVSGAEKIVEVLYEAGQFLLKTAEDAWKFVVRTAEDVLDGIVGLFKLVATVVEDAIVWLASKFEWDGILDVMTLFDELFDTGMDATRGWISDGGKAVDELLLGWEKSVKELHWPPTRPDKLKLESQKTGGEEERAKGFEGNPMFSWARQQVESSNLQQNDDSETDTILRELLTIFTDTFKKTYDEVKGAIDKVWEDLKDYASNDGKGDWFTCMSNVTVDIVASVIECVRLAVKAFFKSVDAFLAWLDKLLNKKLDIWVLTKLFSKITKGKKHLTTKHLASILLAVPTWVVLKLVTGKNPRDVPQMARYLEEIDARPSEIRLMAMARDESGSPRDRDDAVEIEDRLSSDVVFAAPADASSVSPFEKVLRVTPLLRGMFLEVFSLVDMRLTILAWFTGGSGKRDPPLLLGTRFFATALVSWATCPLPFKGPEKLRNLRFNSWLAVTAINAFKCFVPGGPPKATLSGLAGLVDLVMNIVICVEEGSELHEIDDIGTILGRFFADLWALGSCYNGFTKGEEWIGLIATLADGAALTIETIITIPGQVDYYVNHADDPDYKMPGVAHSLCGSQS